VEQLVSATSARSVPSLLSAGQITVHGAGVTMVRVAGSEATLPAALVKSVWYCQPLSSVL
jgi:hypothetical protein